MYGASSGAAGLTAQAVVHGVEMIADVADVRHRADEAKMLRQRGQLGANSQICMPGTRVAIGR